MGPTGSTTRLTLPVIAPPLPDVDGASLNGAVLVVVRPLAYHREVYRRAEEHDERQLSQVDLMDLIEELLPQSRIRCRQFLLVEGIQGRVAVEVNVGGSRGRDLVARE